jgi:outer membrane protein assembly factor BamB
MLPLGSLAVALALAVPAIGAAPVVTESWVSPQQVASVAVDDTGTIFAVDENTFGALILRAYDPAGTQLWRRSWRPAGSTLNAIDVALGPNGTLLVSGTIRPDPPGDCSDIWTHGWAIAVWDRTGDLLWHRAERGWRSCDAFAESGGAVAGRGSTIALATRQATEYSIFASVVAFNLNGHRRWRYDFEERGTGHQWINDLAVGPGSAVYLTGTFNVATLDEPPTDQEALAEKLDPDGSLAWRRVVPDPAARDEWAGDVTLAGGTVFVSSITSIRDGYRARVASYSTEGELRWERLIDRVVRSDWGDAFLATQTDQTVFATSRRDADGTSTHIALRAYAGDGTALWTEQLRRPVDGSSVVTGLAASDTVLVVIGRPPGLFADRSVIWVLQSR